MGSTGESKTKWCWKIIIFYETWELHAFVVVEEPPEVVKSAVRENCMGWFNSVSSKSQVIVTTSDGVQTITAQLTDLPPDMDGVLFAFSRPTLPPTPLPAPVSEKAVEARRLAMGLESRELPREFGGGGGHA